MCAMTVSKLMSTCGNNSCAPGHSGGDGRCASNGAFSTGVPVDWGLSQRPARIDCGLSYTTGQATIARSAIVACDVLILERVAAPSPFSGFEYVTVHALVLPPKKQCLAAA